MKIQILLHIIAGVLSLDAELCAGRGKSSRQRCCLHFFAKTSLVCAASSPLASLWSWKARKALAFWSLQAWLRSQSHSNSRFYTLQALISTAVPKSGLRSSHTTPTSVLVYYYYCTSTEHYSRPLPPPILRPDLVQLRLYVVGFELS